VNVVELYGMKTGFAFEIKTLQKVASSQDRLRPSMSAVLKVASVVEANADDASEGFVCRGVQFVKAAVEKFVWTLTHGCISLSN